MVVSLSTREASTVGLVEKDSLGLEFWAADLGSSKSGAATANNREGRLEGSAKVVWTPPAILVRAQSLNQKCAHGVASRTIYEVQGEGGGSQLSAAIGVSKEEEKTEGGPRTLKKKNE